MCCQSPIYDIFRTHRTTVVVAALHQRLPDLPFSFLKITTRSLDWWVGRWISMLFWVVETLLYWHKHVSKFVSCCGSGSQCCSEQQGVFCCFHECCCQMSVWWQADQPCHHLRTANKNDFMFKKEKLRQKVWQWHTVLFTLTQIEFMVQQN